MTFLGIMVFETSGSEEELGENQVKSVLIKNFERIIGSLRLPFNSSEN